MNRENKRKQYEKGYYKTHPCNDTFVCKNCGRTVVPEGAGSNHRNHCPNCLYSLHVDIEPGSGSPKSCGHGDSKVIKFGEVKRMNLQQLKYVIAVAEAKSITRAAAALYISQPSLSNAIKELEAETGIVIFVRSRTGVALTKEGMEFLGYARQVIQQMELLEDKYIVSQPVKTRFGVSTQHYTFTENAFVELVERFGQERYEFYFNEAGTHQILKDVKNRISDLGILYLSDENEAVLRKRLEEYSLEFVFLFSAKPHVFLQRNHPLAGRQKLKLSELEPYPRLNFVQGSYESSYYAEELFSTLPVDKEIRINDRGAIVNFMLGLNAYTISSGIFPRYLHGDNIIAIPLDESERMDIGYIHPEKQPLSELGTVYIKEIEKYAPTVP